MIRHLLILALPLTACGPGHVDAGHVAPGNGSASDANAVTSPATTWQFALIQVDSPPGAARLEFKITADAAHPCVDWSVDHMDLTIDSADFPVDTSVKFCAPTTTTLTFPGVPRPTFSGKPMHMTFYPHDNAAVTVTLPSW